MRRISQSQDFPDINKAKWTHCWPGDTIWLYRSGSMLARVMTSCMTDQTITWTDADFSSAKFCRIRQRAISKPMCKLVFCILCLKNTHKELLLRPPGFSELISAIKWPLISLIWKVLTIQLPVQSIYESKLGHRWGCSWPGMERGWPSTVQVRLVISNFPYLFRISKMFSSVK